MAKVCHAHYAMAAKYYEIAARQGKTAAATNLGALYRTGTGVPQDFQRAMSWLMLAARQGNAAADLGEPAAMAQPGYMHGNSITHLRVDLALAYALYTAATSGNSPDAEVVQYRNRLAAELSSAENEKARTRLAQATAGHVVDRAHAAGRR